MASMTPDRPPQRRRLTSPLHEMDDGVPENDLVPETPIEDRMHPGTLAQIVRSEIQNGISPLQMQVADLNANMSLRLDRVENKLRDHDVKILKLEKLVAGNGSVSSAASSPQHTDRLQQYEKEIQDLKRQFGSLKLGAVEPQTDAHKTVVIGGLQGLESLKRASQWLEEKCAKWMGHHVVAHTRKENRFMISFLQKKQKQFGQRHSCSAATKQNSQ